MRPAAREWAALRVQQRGSSTILVVVSHVEIALHRGLKHGVARAGHHVGLPKCFHGWVRRELEVHDDLVHDLGECGEVDAVAAAV